MTVLFDTVDGCVLTIQDIHSSIPFTTPSDALFSSLFVKFKGTVPMELFEAMLALFRHADFHSSAVTIQKSEGILDRISIQRQQIAKDRNSMRVTVQIACRPPTACLSQAGNKPHTCTPCRVYRIATTPFSSYDRTVFSSL